MAFYLSILNDKKPVSQINANQPLSFWCADDKLKHLILTRTHELRATDSILLPVFCKH